MTLLADSDNALRKEPHWYHTTFYEGCVLCGRGQETVRKRMRGDRPDDPRKLYSYDYSTFACGDHFS